MTTAVGSGSQRARSPVTKWVPVPVPVPVREFDIPGATETVPAVLWRPTHTPGPLPLVLLGHGGSGHKRSDRLVRMATRFALAGAIVAAIDSPYHGERVATAMSTSDYQARMVADGPDRVVDEMVEDWRKVIDVLVTSGTAEPNNVAYVGLSLGTRFGIPLAARLGDGLACAVLGKFGLVQSAVMPSGLDMTARMRADAARVTTPVLFHVQTDDELFARAGQVELFDLMPSPDKRLLEFPGGHTRTNAESEEAWGAFVVAHLGLGEVGDHAGMPTSAV